MTATTRSPSLRIYLLGQPRFVSAGEPYRFAAPPKALSLVAYLLVHRSVPLSREKLAFTLWEDDTEDGARANFRRHLHHIQKALPQAPPDVPWIIADADAVQWNPASDYWLDVAEFDRLAKAPASRTEAVEQYGGDLLDTLYDEWLLPERDRLRNLFLATLAELLIEARGRRDFNGAVALAQRILTSDPWREDTLRQLMAVRYESGDRAGALAAYQSFDRRLRDEMNVEPMPETAVLKDVILRNAPLADSLNASPPDGFHPTRNDGPLLPFVGRGDEMERLRMSWSRAARGRGSVVMIGGEAGIGKSRLASEFALAAGAQGARVMSGTTTYPESAPYQSIAESLRSVAPLLASLNVEPVWLGVVANAVPELRARRPELPTPPPVEPERERIRLFEAMAKCFEQLARPRPLLIVLEDVHWAGETTIAALSFLARRLVQLPILVVVTYRDEEAPRSHPLRRLRAELQEAKNVAVIAPRPLDQAAVADIVSRVPALAERGTDLAHVLVERSAGNPLFLTEVIRDLVERPAEFGAEPPSSAKQVIAARVDRLPEQARALADVAAIVGQGFNMDMVRDVAGWSENEVFDALGELIDRHIVKETGGRSGYAYSFSHHLIQRSIYAGVAPEVRIRRHRHIARVLAETYATRSGQFAADIAYHHDHGNEPEKAAAAYLSAARRAQEVYAYDEALSHVRRCLDLATDATTRFEALGLRERIGARRGDRDSQRDDLVELTALAAQSGDVRALANVLRRKIVLARALGEREEERRLIEAFEEKVGSGDDRPLRAEAKLIRAAYEMLTGDSTRAALAANQSLALYREVGDATGQIEARCRIVEIATETGAFDEASAILGEVRASPEGMRNPGIVARAMMSVTYGALMEQRYDVCRALSKEARELYKMIGDREGEGDAIARQASGSARMSLMREALACYDEAAEIYRAIGKRQGLAGVLVNRGIHSVKVGLFDDADRSLRAALPYFRELKDRRGQAACAVNLSYLALLRGDPAEAQTQALAGIEHARSSEHAVYEAAALGNLGAAERDLGNLPQAIAHMKEGLEIRRRLTRPADYADDIAHLICAQLSAGDLSAVRELNAELAAPLLDESTVMLLPQFAHWISARAYRALGDEKSTNAAVERAYAILEEQSALIEGAAERATYLSLAVNREIRSAHAEDRWPETGGVRKNVGRTSTVRRRATKARSPSGKEGGDAA
jgi:DNA-binding SARP family transcriptional activator/tetratricopeptide (TPR) repeat protein